MAYNFIFLLLALIYSQFALAQSVHIGSKNFTEGYVTAEILAQTIESETNHKVDRQFGLGGTGIVFEALRAKQIDMYIDYTGTLREAILKLPVNTSSNEFAQALLKNNLVISSSLGFNNTYALAVRREFAEKNKLHKISDLTKSINKIRVGLSHEFFSRQDGYVALLKHYDLPMMRDNIRMMEHSLLYTAIENNRVDLIEVYSTDGKLAQLDLVLLEDDLKFFPNYEAVIVTRSDFVKSNQELWLAIKHSLENTITNTEMIRLNSLVDFEKKSFKNAAFSHFGKSEVTSRDENLSARLKKRTREHLTLVLTALFFCILIGVPLGLLALRSNTLAQVVMLISGLFQTIPSLALLCFLIPLFGIGRMPAMIALILYGLLPIIVNTYVGISSLNLTYADTARALGMSFWQKLFWVDLPLASPYILSGIKTSAIVTIGTATLAALIGAGGYGAPIITGLAINDTTTILIGAIPAALMALFAHFIFMGLNYLIVPKGLNK